MITRSTLAFVCIMLGIIGMLGAVELEKTGHMVFYGLISAFILFVGYTLIDKSKLLEDF